MVPLFKVPFLASGISQGYHLGAQLFISAILGSRPRTNSFLPWSRVLHVLPVLTPVTLLVLLPVALPVLLLVTPPVLLPVTLPVLLLVTLPVLLPVTLPVLLPIALPVLLPVALLDTVPVTLPVLLPVAFWYYFLLLFWYYFWLHFWLHLQHYYLLWSLNQNHYCNILKVLSFISLNVTLHVAFVKLAVWKTVHYYKGSWADVDLKGPTFLGLLCIILPHVHIGGHLAYFCLNLKPNGSTLYTYSRTAPNM